MQVPQIAIQLIAWVVGWYLFLFISPVWFVLTFWNFVTGNTRSSLLSEQEELEDVSSPMRWGTSRYIQLKDVNIHYVEAGDKRNQLMLCLHGFPEFWFSWRHQLKEFASTHWVVAVDLRGYGRSEKPSGRSSYHYDLLVEDVRQIITLLGKDKCILMAHDWGALIGWRVVHHYPELISQYIPMNCPHPAAFQQTLVSDYTQMLKSWYIFFFQLPMIPERLTTTLISMGFRKRVKQSRLSPGEAQAYLDVFDKPSDLTPPINYYRNLVYSINDPNFPRSLISVPTLLIWGEKDNYLNISMASLSSNYVENFSLFTVAGATHWVQQDAPDVVNEKIRQFIGKPGKKMSIKGFSHTISQNIY